MKYIGRRDGLAYVRTGRGLQRSALGIAVGMSAVIGVVPCATICDRTCRGIIHAETGYPDGVGCRRVFTGHPEKAEADVWSCARGGVGEQVEDGVIIALVIVH